MKRNRALGRLLLALAPVLISGGCATFVNDSAPVPGTDDRLVVGGKEGFSSLKPRIWVVQNGEYILVKIYEETWE